MRRRVLRKGALALALIGVLAAFGCEPEGNGIRPGASPASGSLGLTADDRLLVIASEDHDQVLVLDRETREVLHRVDVSDGPTHLVVDGNLAIVSARYGHSLDVVNVESGQLVRSIQVGVEPIGLTKLGDGRVAVALAGEQAVAIVNTEQGAVEKKIALAALDPRAVARLEDGRLFVTHLSAGVMSEVELARESVRTVDLTTRNDFGPRVVAEHLRSLTVAPDGKTLMMAHSQANTDTVRAPISGDGFEDPGMGGDCGYSGCASELPAVTPSVTEVETETGTVLVPQPAPLDQGNQGGGFVEGEPMPDCFDCGFGFAMTPNPPSILNPNEGRFAGVPINNPVALALFDGGRGQLVLNLGSRNVLMMRRDLRGTADDVLGVVNVGHGASSIVVTNAGDLAYVWNQFDGSVTEIELPKLGQEVETQTKFVPDQAGEPSPAEFREVAEIAADTFDVVEDALAPLVSRGRKLFHDALDPRISQHRAVSCASCHPDGRADGRTWQFTFGPRNTPQLGGGILDTAPFHWPGDVETIRDLNSMTVLAFMGGSGLDADSMDAIGAFIDTIPAAPSKVALAPELNEAQLRGKAVFEDAEVGCTSCHAGRHFTDNVSWNIGTQAGFQDISSFQTPVLHGLSRSAPYLHDGSARTLRDLVDTVVRTDKMGHGSHLSEQQLDDLVEYLKTL